MDRQDVLIGNPEQTNEIDRVRFEGIRTRNGDAIGFDREIGGRQRLSASAKTLHEAVEVGAWLGLAFFEGGADDRGQVAYVLRDKEIMLHEALDGGEPAAVLITEPVRNNALHTKTQPRF